MLQFNEKVDIRIQLPFVNPDIKEMCKEVKAMPLFLLIFCFGKKQFFINMLFNMLRGWLLVKIINTITLQRAQ